MSLPLHAHFHFQQVVHVQEIEVVARDRSLDRHGS